MTPSPLSETNRVFRGRLFLSKALAKCKAKKPISSSEISTLNCIDSSLQHCFVILNVFLNWNLIVWSKGFSMGMACWKRIIAGLQCANKLSNNFLSLSKGYLSFCFQDWMRQYVNSLA